MHLLRRAGEWFLRSGIQTAEGGVARYYRADLGRNNPVSTEITGYAVSALCYFSAETGHEQYLEGALKAGRFLTRMAWDSRLQLFPFEWGSGTDGSLPPAYFFDTGIIIRGLLRLYRAVPEEEFFAVAQAAGISMARAFEHQGAFAPVLHLPDRRPAEYGGSWSNNPGCYQLKSALAWLELHEDTGEQQFLSFFEKALDRALADAPSFLPGTHEKHRVMDRLHAFCYFLEALLPLTSRPNCWRFLREGIETVSALLREIRPEFVRSDVYAQLLRVRLHAHHLGVVPINEGQAREEAEAMTGFQFVSPDARINGGFCFGMHESSLMPYANPVSTAFCLQAWINWRKHLAGEFDESWRDLI